MNEDDDALSVGFEIDFRDSFGRLRTLDDMVGEAAAQMFRQMQSMEKSLGMPISAIRNLTQETRQFSRDRKAAERAGEGLSRQLDREIANYGKSKTEIIATRIATAALASEKFGLTEQSERLRSKLAELQAMQQAEAAAAAAQAQALRDAAFAHQMFEARVRQGVVAMREAEAATRADAAAKADLAARAQRLVESVNPAAAAQNRFNAEMAEARALVAAGAISLDDYVLKLRLEKEALDTTNAAVARGAISAGAHRQAMMGASYQVQDFITQVSMGANPVNAFAVQGAQLAGQFANVEGKAGALARFFMGPWGLAITGALMVVGMLTKGLFDASDAADKGKEKFVDLSDATARQKASVVELKKAIDDYNQSQQRQNETTRYSIQLALAAADADLKRALAARVALAAQLAQQQDREDYLQRNMGGNVDRGLSQGIENRIAENAKTIKGLQDEISNRTIELGKIAAKTLDPLEAVKQKYDDIAAAAERAARLSGNGRAFGAPIGDVLVEIERRRKIAEAQARAESQGSTSTANRDARVGDMVALIKQLFPGAQIASTIGGRHVKGSDHYAGRAIDFVPGGGMKQYTTAEVEKILKNAGVDIRRNANGTQQLFGPGRSASKPGDHDNHFHVAWQGSPDTKKVDAEKARALEEAKRAYDALVKAAQDYATTQMAEAATVGLSAKELRLYADAAAIAKAPTIELKKAISDAAASREESITIQNGKDFDANVLQPLRDELTLYGLTGPARDYAALGLEKQAFMAKHVGDGIKVAEERWKQYYDAQRALIDKDAAAALEAARIRELNDALGRTAETWDLIARNVDNASRGMSDAFGNVGGALGDLASIYTNFEADRARGHAEHVQRLSEMKLQADKDRENARYAVANSTAQIGLYGDMTAAAKGFFKEKSAGWKIVGAAEKAFRAIEFAMSVKAMVQNLAETAGFVANSAAKATAAGTEGIANQSKLPFPFNIVAMAATGAALIAAGVAIFGGRGGGGSSAPVTNEGRGTVLGDSNAQSESIKNAINALKDVDVLMLNYSRQMAASLKTIESSIGGFASLIVRNAEGVTNGNGIVEGFKTSGIGSVLSKIPLIGGILGGLFGTKTTLLGSGISAGAQSLGSILAGGFDADYYTTVNKKKKFLGLTTSNKTKTTYTDADPLLENQFTLILKSFNDAILAAAGPLGAATNEIQQRLNGFVLNIGQIDLKGLTGAEIEEKLTAVFGAAADKMARAAFPMIDQFQRAGEGAFETLVRVASTLEAVTATLDLLGQNATGIGIAAKLGLADQFDSVSDFSSAVDSYFSAYYSKAEQAAARTAQMGQVFASLGMTMPTSLAGFRALVEAQNLNTEAGRETYATLLKLAPAFAELQTAMEGAKSAADIASERADLQRQLLELQGDTAALRALQLAKLDASNRELQQQIWAIQDAQAAAKAADELRKAWQSVSDSIMDEVRRIRGLTDAGGGNNFASLMSQFNVATNAARGGDMDAAKSLPQLSQALLAAAADAATSRQELDRIRAQIAASLEATNGLIGALAGNSSASNASLLDSAASSQSSSASNDNGGNGTADSIDELREETARLRADLTAALAQIAANTGAVKRTLENVTTQSGGDAISTVAAA